MEKIAFGIYLFVIAASPLLFAAVHTWAYTIIFLCIFAAFLLQIRTNISRDPGQGDYRLRVLNMPLYPLFAVLFLYLVFQVTPLPDDLLRLISPSSLAVGKSSLSPSGVLDGVVTGDWFAVASYAYPVRQSMIRLVAYFFFFLGLVQALNSRFRIRTAVIVILAVGFFESMYGLIQTYSRYEHIWWFKKIAHRGDVTGTYLNRNHFAGFMEMGILLAAGFAVALAGEERRQSFSRVSRRIKSKIIRHMMVGRFLKSFLIVFAGAIMGVGLVFSASRGGIIAIAVALLALGLFFVFRRNHRRAGFVALAIFAIMAAYALPIGLDYVLGRFERLDPDFKDRAAITSKTMLMYEEYPLTGIGVGDYRFAFERYQDIRHKKLTVGHAHNDWAQWMAEAGLIGLALLLLGLAWYLYRVICLWVAREDSFAVGLGIVPVAVIVGIAVHSVSDFNLHVPANALLLAAVLAIGYSALHSEKKRMGEKHEYAWWQPKMRYQGIVVVVVAAGLILYSGVWTVRHFVAEAYCNTLYNDTLNLDQNPPLEAIRKAAAWDPWNAEYRYKKARELMRQRDEWKKNYSLGGDEAGYTEDQAMEDRRRDLEIIGALEEAVRLNPFAAEYRQRLGWFYTYLWREPDYHSKWLPTADMAMEKAAYFAGMAHPRMHVDLGHYWVMRSRSLDRTHPMQDSVWARACWHYQKARELDQAKAVVEEITRYVQIFYPDNPERLQEALGT